MSDSLLSAAQYAEAVLARAYHRSTAFEMADDLRVALDACPCRAWDKMQPGHTYLYTRYRGADQLTFQLVSFTPSKRQAHVLLRARDNYESARKIYRSEYTIGVLTELAPELITLLGVSHRSVLSAAITHGLLHEIPGTVRREEPDLFVVIPDRFDTEVLSRSNKGRGPDRLRTSLAPRWREPITPALIDEWIESAHEQIAAYQEEKFAAVQLNPKLAGDYDRYIADAQETIDWYRWVQTTVEEGGVFSI